MTKPADKDWIPNLEALEMCLIPVLRGVYAVPRNHRPRRPMRQNIALLFNLPQCAIGCGGRHQILGILMACFLWSGAGQREIVAAERADWLAIRDSVVSRMLENRKKLTVCKLVWTRKSQEDNFLPGRGLETAGEYQMWLKDNKEATEYVQDVVYETDKGVYSKARSGQRTAFNGADFRAVPIASNKAKENPRSVGVANKPEYRLHENWLKIIGWEGHSSWIEQWQDGRLPENVSVEDCTIERSENGSLCRIAIRNTSEGGRVVVYHNLDQGCCLQREEWYDSKGRLTLERTHRMEQVDKSLWFPVEVNVRSINPDSGSTTLLHTYALDTNQSVFGNPSAVPDSVFEIPITADMRVTDIRAGTKIRYNGETAPLSISALKERVADFLRTQPAANVARWGTTRTWVLAVNIAVLVVLALAFFYRRWRRSRAVL